MALAVPTFLEIPVVLILGLIFGSFATAVTYREARGLKWFSLWREKLWSECPSCHTRLTLRDLVPVVSWVMSRGACRHCGVKVSARYPLIEIVSALACLGFYAVYGFSASAFLLMALVPFLIALFFIDLDTMLLPNRLVVICFVIAALWFGVEAYQRAWNNNFILEHAIAGLVLPLLFWVTALGVGKVLGKDAIGMGDIKFLAPAGLLTGLSLIPAYLIASGVLGLISYGVIHLKSGVDGQKKSFPFGPALILSLYGVMLYKGYIYQ